MPHIHSAALAHARRRWLRADAHRFIRADWRRFVRPGSELAALYESFERKYSLDQPRVPSGVPEGGQWTGGGTTSNNPRQAQALPFARPMPLLAEPPVTPRPVIKPPLEEWPTNPKEAPPGFEWKGQPGSSPGDEGGSYVRPGPGPKDEYLRYDDSPGHKPHWDYRTPNGDEYRWYPDGTLEPKRSKPIIMYRLET